MNKYERDFSHEVLKTFGLAHNYNQWIFDMMKPYVGKNILEVGCGTGNMTFFLKNCGKLTCLDRSESYMEHTRIDNPGVAFLSADIADPSLPQTIGKKFDTITCINVLEHIKDDERALMNMKDMLEKNGRLLLFVPALSALYGSLDRQLDHFRRYDLGELSHKLSACRLKTVKIFYSNFVGIFGWYINSRLLKRKRFSIIQPLIFDKFVPVIEKIEKSVKPPIGMSIFAVCENE